MTLEKGKKVTLLIRLEKGSEKLWFSKFSDQICILLFKQINYIENELNAKLFVFLILGLLSMILIYNTFYYFIIKDKSALYLNLFLISWELFLLTAFGLGFEIFWPNLPIWDMEANTFFICFSISFYCLFVRKHLNLEEHYPLINKFFFYLSFFVFSLTITEVLDYSSINELIQNLLYTSIFVMGSFCSLKLYRSKKAPTFYFFIGNTSVLICQLVISLGLLKLLPINIGLFQLYNFGQFAILIQIIFYLLSLLDRYRFAKEEIKKQEILKIEFEIKNKALHALEESKNKFFSQLSHEFKTPLSIVLGQLEMWSKSLKIKDQNEISTSLQTVKQLEKLVLRLADVSKTKRIDIELLKEKTDLNVFINQIINMFSTYSLDKKNSISLITPHDSLICDFDQTIFYSIISNIISNAIKYSKENSLVKIYTESDYQTITIKIKDNGLGISETDLVTIFEPYYRVNNDQTKHIEGTGLGLNLVKELIEAHQGSIKINSCLNKGTTVYLKFPYENLTKTKAIDSYPKTNNFLTNKNNLPDNFSILIVDDHKLFRDFVANILDTFNAMIYQASNGIDAFDKACEFIPDLIITDISMPYKDGLELVENLQKELKTSHIPIIIISGRNMHDQKMAGLKAGALSYLSKPFQPEELILMVNLILQQQIKYKKQYKALLEHSISNNDYVFNNYDESFMLNVKFFIAHNLSNSNLSIKNFCNEFNMSESVLYRKIKGLTGVGIIQLIKNERLLKSKVLLKTTNKTILTIANECGFKSVSYFNSLFKESVDLTPSEFRQMHENKPF